MTLALLAGVSHAGDLKPIEQALRSGNYAQCIDLASAAIAAKEPDERCRLLLIRAQLELGRYAEAAQSLDAALQSYPLSIRVRWLGREVVRFAGKPERAGLMEEEILQFLRQSAWRYGDPESRIVLGKLLLQQGLEPKRILEGTYSALKKQQPDYAPVWLATGELALEKGDYALAAENFQKAAQLDPTDPEPHFGLARAFAPSERAKSQAELGAALERNPRHVSSLLLVADALIDSESYAAVEEVLAEIEGVNPRQPLALAYRAVLAHLRNDTQQERHWRDAALSTWSTNPAVDHLLGKKLSQKYRFAEGAAAQRRALVFDPTHLPARSQLAQDLLRLGIEEEGWKVAAEVYAADGYNVFAHNLVELRDTLEKFRTLESDGILLRMDPREAEIYGARVLALLQRAKQSLSEKYEVQLPTPIIVEMFPRQQDFAIRTFGLPGGEGFLGVCFGTVITANSPASQAERPTCWEATLWHEFCHVATLNKTRNRMPRWLSEGISVYEERLANPAWGQSMNPQYRELILGEELTPVSRLSGAFLNPKSGLHLQFAYYESSLVVEYLISQYGWGPFLKMLSDLGQGMEVNDALTRLTGSVSELNKAFTTHIRDLALQWAPEADFTSLELPPSADETRIRSWLTEHPRSQPGLLRLARVQMAARQWDPARATLDTLRGLFANHAGDEVLFTLLAQVHRERQDSLAEQEALERLTELSASNIPAIERLAELAVAAGDWETAHEQAQRWLAVNPLQPAAHRLAARAAEQLGHEVLAVESCRALLKLDPLDPAELHHRLGRIALRRGDTQTARREALWALEKTPRYRDAQKLLLEAARAGERPPEPPLLEGSP